MEQQSIQSAISDLVWRVSSLETKVKLNEQNFFNSQERIQLVSRNFLDLKRELRDRSDNISDEMRDLQKKVDALKEKFLNTPKASDVEQIKKFHESINVFNPEMSAEEAKSILDSVLKKLESGVD